MKNIFFLLMLLSGSVTVCAKEKKKSVHEVKAECQVRIDSLSAALDDEKYKTKVLERQIKELNKKLTEAQKDKDEKSVSAIKGDPSEQK